KAPTQATKGKTSTVWKSICVTFGVSADYLLGIEKESLQIPFHDLTEKQFQILSELISEFTKSNE
ncbi:MAG: hypothetical protein ACI4LB_00900, partial [Candidatus Fimenecus sp.]